MDIERTELNSSQGEMDTRDAMAKLLLNSPIPEHSLLQNLGLFLNSKNLSRILMIDNLYRQILPIHGVVMELGTRWGQLMAVFAALRGIYEPFNRHRKIIGFDTFSGFPSISSNDNPNASFAHEGGATTSELYEEFLSKVMELQEKDNPISHIRKFEIIKGDATETVDRYIEDNPETLVSLAYFDFDIYEPTIRCLEVLWPRCVKGSIIAFDELCDHESPGETKAFLEFFDGKKVKLQRQSTTSRISYIVVE